MKNKFRIVGIKNGITTLVLFFFAIADTFAQLPEMSLSDIASGDLIFAVNQQGNAITASTAESDELQIDHVGILLVDSGISVLEAAPKRGVTITRIDDFLCENTSCVIGRVREADIIQSITNARRFIALPYDSLFEADDNAIYCSELVQKSYVDSCGVDIFTTIPMSFHNSDGAILQYCIDFYSRHNRSVPEGAPGSNPAHLSRNPSVTLIGTIDYRRELKNSARSDESVANTPL